MVRLLRGLTIRAVVRRVTIRTDNPNPNEFIRTRDCAVGLSAAMYVLETSPASRVQPPGGSRTTLERGSRPDFIYADTDKIGVYKVERDDSATRWFTVNLLDSGESNLQPRDEIAIGAERIAAGEERPQPWDLWKWILAAAVLLLLLEWQVYNRRVAV